MCGNCGHPEGDHGPVSGRWTSGEIIPGRLCYFEENQGHCEDLCPCAGYSPEGATSSGREQFSYGDSLRIKSGTAVDCLGG